MRFVHDLPIRRKLALINVVTTAAALMLACAAFVGYEQVTFRQTLTRNLAITAQMIAINTSSALAFEDTGSAEQVLKALAAQPHIVAACVYDGRGAVFAQYRRDAVQPAQWPVPQGNSEAFDAESLQIFRRITLAGENIGTIYVQSDLTELGARWRRYALIAGTVLAVAILVALLVGPRLQRLISQPISSLVEAMAGVSAKESRYSVRVAKRGNDELGQLIDGFNGMLEQIQSRDAELRRAQVELETRVEERTKELLVQIAERQRTEEERDRFFTLSLDLLCIVGFDGSMRRTNPAFHAVLGYHVRELRKMSYLDMVHPDDRALAIGEIEQLKRGKSVLNYETRVCGRDGEYRWIAWSAKAVPEGGCFYAYGRDITERKRAETERETLTRQLLDISRQAGMAEVATSVLHNVGNVLNSVNVSATLVLDEVKNSKVSVIAQLGGLLREHATDLGAFLTDDSRGRQIPNFLQTLAEHLAAEQATILREVESLRKNIEHIKDIVSMQQSYARISGVVETVAVAELVEDAIQMNAGALQRHGVTLTRDYRDRPSITVEKHKVLQILVNLIRNAKYACDESGRAEKRITLQIAAGERSVRISVADNGVGIPAENLTRIFNHGFTTRSHGHGFGLHSGALTAQELGGAIHAASDGPGHGATFTVELPYRPKEVSAA